jgi:hypothetical protein
LDGVPIHFHQSQAEPKQAISVAVQIKAKLSRKLVSVQRSHLDPGPSP